MFTRFFLLSHGVITHRGDRHTVRLCVTNDGKTDASQTNQLSDACTILFGFAKYVITTLSIV